MSEGVNALKVSWQRLASRLPPRWAVVEMTEREGLLCASIEGAGQYELRCDCGQPDCPDTGKRFEYPMTLPVTGTDVEALCHDAHTKLVRYAAPGGRA